MLDEKDLRSADCPGDPEDSSLFTVGAHRYHEGLPNRLQIGIHVADGAIERQDYSYVQAGRPLKVGQAAHCLGQPSGPGIWVILCRYVND